MTSRKKKNAQAKDVYKRGTTLVLDDSSTQHTLTRLTDDVLHQQLQGDLQGVCSDFPPTNLSLEIKQALLFLFIALPLYSITTHRYLQANVFVFVWGFDKYRASTKFLRIDPMNQSRGRSVQKHVQEQRFE